MAKKSNQDNTKIYNPSAKTPDNKMNDYGNSSISDCTNTISDCTNTMSDCSNSVSTKKRNQSNKDIPSYK